MLEVSESIILFPLFKQMKTDFLCAQFNKYNKYSVLSKTFKSGGMVVCNELCIMMGDTSSRERSHTSHRGLIQEALQVKV